MSQKYYDSEKCFRRYEAVIIQAVIAYPEEVRFKPTVRTINTDAARCRDAITSWRLNRWQAAICPVAYKVTLRELTAWSRLGFVCIGPKTSVRRTVSVSVVRPDDEPIDDIPDDIELPVIHEDIQRRTIAEAVVMIDDGLHPGPYYCTSSAENIALVREAIGDRMNVAFVCNGEGLMQIL